MAEPKRRVMRAIKREGVIGASHTVLTKLLPLHPTAYEMAWYGLDLARERPRRKLSDGLVLRRGAADDAVQVAQLPRMPHVAALTTDDVGERLNSGAELWLVADGDRVAFSCWIFHHKACVYGARKGGTPMPQGTAFLEDSILSPDFRGRSISASAWSGVADALEARGFTKLMTKVDVTNIGGTWAFKKAGFREVARMNVEHRGLHHRVQIRFTTDDQSSRWLAALER
jgi:acetyltransferase (GNAT) family protein